MVLGHGRILTTHVGSLPRPPRLLELMRKRYGGESYDPVELDACIAESVAEVVKRQVELGIDLVSDGEMSKISYANYVTERLTGFGGEQWRGHVARDLAEYPELAKRLVKIGAVVPTASGLSCTGSVEPKDSSEVETDLRNFRAALATHRPTGTFMTAASPGVVSVFQRNEYYPTETAYIEAVAEAMRPEYEAIVDAGHTLQLDSADLAMNLHLGCSTKSTGEFCRIATIQVEALNQATRNIPPESMRMHLCWGNYEGPHHHDVPLEAIADIALRARPAILSIEAANPRHAHEWEVFREVKLPENKVLVPGVLDTCTNYIEHPKLIAQRICCYADLVGRDRVIAGSDCGFSTFAGYPTVDSSVAWAKLEALVAGAAAATKRLWK